MAAIANYTSRVLDPTLDAEQIQEALKFIGEAVFPHHMTVALTLLLADHVRLSF